jgi:hypothetical protein
MFSRRHHPDQQGISPADCAQNCYSVRSWVCLCGVRQKGEIFGHAWLVGRLEPFATWSCNWNSSLLSTVLMFVSWTSRTLSRVEPSDPRTVLATGRTAGLAEEARLLWCAIVGFAAPGGCCHTLKLLTRPVKLVSACVLPTRPLIKSDLTDCPSGEFSVLIAGDLNVKHTSWNSKLIKTRGSLLLDCTNRISCFVCGVAPQPRLHTHTSIADALWYIDCLGFCSTIASDCSTLSRDHVSVLVDTVCRSYFQNLLDRLPSYEWSGLHFGLSLKTDSRGIPLDTTKCVEELTRTIKRSLRHLYPRGDPVPTLGLLYRPVYGFKYTWRSGWGVSGESWTSPWKPTLTAYRGRWPIGWTPRAGNTGAIRWNPRTVKTSRYGNRKKGWCELLLLRPLFWVPVGLTAAESEKAGALADRLRAYF